MADLECSTCAITFLGDIFHASSHYKPLLTPKWIGLHGYQESFLGIDAAPSPFTPPFTHVPLPPAAPRTCNVITATRINLQKPERIYLVA